ncbi:Zinc finger protein 749 [Plakobranchus ocellatus]|uniref:Zinc finger protein 749 n=1 Tax=Plakobranchus ocellatus TaxID=259542 RepID=A0AAV4B0X7_9GAST|nr:Zinc finger protein 749 [Plakobranchus ocellatus]
MECCEKRFLYNIEAPGVLYMTLDGHGPIYVDFKHKLKLEICLFAKDEKQMVPDLTKTVHILLEKTAAIDSNEMQFQNHVELGKRLNSPSETKKSKAPGNFVSEIGKALTKTADQNMKVNDPEEIDDVDCEIQDRPLASQTIHVSSAPHKGRNSLQKRPDERSRAKVVRSSIEVAPKLQCRPADEVQRDVEKEKQNLLMLKRSKRTSAVLTKAQLEKLMMSCDKKSKVEETACTSDCASGKEISELSRDKGGPGDLKLGTDGDLKPISCKYCDCSFPSQKEFDNHWKHTPINYHVCLKCYTAFPFKAYLLVHLRYHDIKDAHSFYKCAVCKVKCATLSDLKRHTLIHTGEHRFKCCTCTKTFTTHRLLMQHLTIHRPKGLIKCSCCNQFFPSRMALCEHKLSVRKLKCGICGQVFPNQASRKIHFMSDHNDTILRCQVCGRMYSTKEEMAKHKLEHIKHKRKQCPVCGKLIYGLKSHLRTHKSIDEMPESELFMCDQCPKKFKDAGTLKEHTRRHTLDKLKCHLCPAGFLTQNGLTRHLNNVHSSLMPYQCEICGKRCKQKFNLRVHMRIHSDVKKFPCNFCDQGFNYKSSLQGHLRSKHSSETIFEANITPVDTIPKNESISKLSARSSDQPSCSITLDSTSNDKPSAATSLWDVSSENYSSTTVSSMESNCLSQALTIPSSQEHMALHLCSTSSSQGIIPLIQPSLATGSWEHMAGNQFHTLEHANGNQPSA